MSRQIVLLGDPVLRQTAEPLELSGRVDEATRRLVEDMREALHDQEGVGLAAPQVGEGLRIFITNVINDQERVYINPEIVETSIEIESREEGCLSIPGVYAEVERPTRVRLQAWNLKGRAFIMEAEKMLARAIQHELDHLNGRLIFDHLDDADRARFLNDFQTLRGSATAADSQPTAVGDD